MGSTTEVYKNLVIAARAYNERITTAERVRICAEFAERGDIVEDNRSIPSKPTQVHLDYSVEANRDANMSYELFYYVFDAIIDNDTCLQQVCNVVYKDAWFLQAHANFALHLYGSLYELVGRRGEDCYNGFPVHVMNLIEALVPAAARPICTSVLKLRTTARRLTPKSRRPHVMLRLVLVDYKDTVNLAINQQIVYTTFNARITDYITLMQMVIVNNLYWLRGWAFIIEACMADPTLMDDRAFRVHYRCMKFHVELAARTGYMD